jgi:hypothetical protein
MVSAAWLFAVLLLYVMANEYQQRAWRAERKDLYDRLMAGSLNDYREQIQEKPPPKGGNMVTAGLKKAADQQMKMLGGDG